MKQILNESERIDYVTYYDFMKFVHENFPNDIKWNRLHDTIIKWGVFNTSELKTYYVVDDILRNKSEYRTIPEEGIYWLQQFFLTHSWMNRVMFVFDS